MILPKTRLYISSRSRRADFDSLGRKELIELLKTAVAETDINAVKTKIALIKVAFLKKKEGGEPAEIRAGDGRRRYQGRA